MIDVQYKYKIQKEVIYIFENIGKKIKILAQAVCWIGIIISVIYCMVIISSNNDAAIVGLLVIVFGALTSWVSSFVLYGFGEIIEKLTVIADSKKTYSFDGNTSQRSNAQAIKSEPAKEGFSGDYTGTCGLCGAENEKLKFVIVTLADDRGTRYRKVCEKCYNENKSNIK